MAANRQKPTSNELLAQLPLSPDAYVHKIDPARDAVLVMLLSAADYRSASFLDDRILTTATRGGWLPTARAVEASGQVRNPKPLHFIFHTGHVGSTLISRLLDETGLVLSLREPLPLRSLADAHDVLQQPESLLSHEQFAVLHAATRRLWSRGYDTTHSVVVKATSSAGRLASTLLGEANESRAIYLNLRAEPYLATLLAGPNSPVDLRGHGPGRIRRLQSQLPVPLAPLHALSLGELAAMSWLVETCAQCEAQRVPDARVLPLDFDQFLIEVTVGMDQVLAHFNLPRDALFLAKIAHSPVLTRYSKAAEHAYSPAIRQRVLNDSRLNNRQEIRRGMAWLEQLANSNSTVADVLNRTGP